MSRLVRLLVVALVAVSVAVCAAGCASSASPPLAAIDRRVDLERFSGDWYVIAHIPVTIPFFDESDAHAAVESYRMLEDGGIDITYRFRRGALDGPVKEMRPSAWVHDTRTNAEWRVRFVWPFRSAYLIAWLNDDYTRTIIGVPSREYVWLMSRDPVLPQYELDSLVRLIEELGYRADDLRLIPQHPPEAREPRR